MSHYVDRIRNLCGIVLNSFKVETVTPLNHTKSFIELSFLRPPNAEICSLCVYNAYAYN
jgi:hypothetical protein